MEENAADRAGGANACENANVETGASPLGLFAAGLLEEGATKRTVLVSDDLARRAGVSKPTLRRYLDASAELCVQRQLSLPREILQVLKRSPHLTAVAAIQYCSYDETPMVVRMDYGSAEAGLALDKELAKVWVIRQEWALLLREKAVAPQAAEPQSSYLLLRGAFSPSIRGGAQTNADTILDVLQSSPSFPDLDTTEALLSIRLSETDSAGANLLAEHTLAAPVSRMVLHTHCQAHFIHAAATKTWTMNTDLVSGITRVSLALCTTHAMGRVRAALDNLIRTKLRVIRGGHTLAPEALLYRNAILTCYAPPTREPKRRGPDL